MSQHPDATLIIAGGRVIDPAVGTDGIMDVSISGDKIIGVAPDIARSPQTKVINAEGCLVTPGLIDLHTHIYRGFGGWTFGAAIDPDEFPAQHQALGTVSRADLSRIALQNQVTLTYTDCPCRRRRRRYGPDGGAQLSGLPQAVPGCRLQDALARRNNVRG